MPKRKIPAKQAVADIRSGMPDAALMEKYRLSAKGLQTLFSKLLEANLLAQSELDNRAEGKSLDRPKETPRPTEPVAESPGRETAPEPEPPVSPEPLAAKEEHGDQPAAPESEFPEREDAEQAESDRKWHEHWSAVVAFLVLFFPLGLYLLWKSRSLRIATKTVLTVFVTGLAAAAIVHSKADYSMLISSWTGRKGKETRIADEAPPPLSLVERQLTGPCDEKDPPYPVRRLRKHAPAKEVLGVMIKLQVFLHDASPKQYYDTLRYFIQDEPPEGKLLFRDLFAEEYGCRMEADDMEMMKHIVNDIIEDKIAKGFQSSTAQKVVNENDGSDKDVPEDLERKSQWLRGQPFMARLKLVKKDSADCNRAVTEMLIFVNHALDKAFHDRGEYEKVLSERENRIAQCKKRMEAGETPVTKR